MMTAKKAWIFAVAAAVLLAAAGSPRADTVVAKEDKVIVQTYIGPREEVRGYMSKGETGNIFNRTDYAVVIDGKEAPWYFVQTASGLTGWVFGGDVTFVTGASGFRLVNVQKITDGTNTPSSPSISPDNSRVAYAELLPGMGRDVYAISVYDTKAKKSRLIMTTQYLLGPNFGGLAWRSNDHVSIHMYGPGKSYSVEFPADGSSGASVTENPLGDPRYFEEIVERLAYMYRKDKDVLESLKELRDFPGQLEDTLVFHETKGRFFACYSRDDAPGRRFLPELRVLNLDDRSVSSIPFYTQRTSAPWSGLVTRPNFSRMGSQDLFIHPKDSETVNSVHRIGKHFLEHLFDIPAAVIDRASIYSTYKRDDILYFAVRRPFAPDSPIQLYKYSAGTPPRVVVPKSARWTDLVMSPDGKRVAFLKWIKGKSVLFTAEVEEGEAPLPDSTEFPFGDPVR